MNKSQLGKKEKVMLVLVVIMLLIMLFTTIFLIRGTRPFNRAKAEAEELALTYGKIKEPEEFFYYQRNGVYYAVKGENNQGKLVYALIPEDGKEITILNRSDGISEDEALKIAQEDNPKASFLKIGLGKEEDQVVWEISGKSDNGTWLYYLISYKDGTIISKVTNI